MVTGLTGVGAAAFGACGNGAGGTAESPTPEGGSTSQAGQGVRALVVGAGAFGGWTALELLRRGAQVTLVDAWGPGNSRASSGGETRVIRATYGPDRIYSEMVVRALARWKEAGERWGDRLFFETGALWMSDGVDPYATDAVPILADLGVPFEELTGEELGRRFPQIDPEGIAYTSTRRAPATCSRGAAASGCSRASSPRAASTARRRRPPGPWRAGPCGTSGSKAARRSRPTSSCSRAVPGSPNSSPGSTRRS